MVFSPPEPGPAGCRDCGLAPERRRFLQELGLVTAAVLLGLGVPRQRALAMTPSPLRARRGTDDKITYPIPAADGVQIDRDNQVILVRWQGAVYAFNLACPHQNTALRWDAGDSRFQCPKHHSKYQPDGTFVSGRATRGMDRFTLARSGDNVVVDVDDMHKEDKDPTGWAAAMLKV
ncbi:MAG: ubiquinol-cytochrome c reductase iron-sulfur subunit [Deltaproteobacteria bacterium]